MPRLVVFEDVPVTRMPEPPLPDATFRVPLTVPPTVVPVAPFTTMPEAPLGIAAAPAAFTPTRFDLTKFPIEASPVTVTPAEPLPESTLGAPVTVPIWLFDELMTTTPVNLFGIAEVPAAFVPIRFPLSALLPPETICTPTSLPEMTLNVSVFELPPRTSTPLKPLGSAASPAAFTPT
ncbi:MAG: hypothetical protein AUG02_01575 [Chloroflexi bacterium 13_1_20CM_2_70_9]|nr:MAG: hypothetical protein AUG02_01575 [Chloroflexi bacterium 13_1_20CM_2_70_9]